MKQSQKRFQNSLLKTQRHSYIHQTHSQKHMPPESIEQKRPRVGASVLLEDNGKFLLGRRNKVNAFGKWVIPGGGVEWG